jgi:hypothetical protein
VAAAALEVQAARSQLTTAEAKQAYLQETGEWKFQVREEGGFIATKRLRDLGSCPANTIFGQGPHGPDDDWSAGTSEVDIGDGTSYLRAENFLVPAATCDLHWWGIWASNPGTGFAPCTDSNPELHIGFHPDVAGAPGPETCSYDVTMQGTGTGVFPIEGFEIFAFDYTLPTCCAVLDGWVSIQGGGDTDCWFLWWSSADGDGSSYLAEDGVPSADTVNLAVCLTGVIEPGACCNPFTASCQDNVEAFDCLPPMQLHPGELCAELDPVCGGIPGACCEDADQTCTDNVLAANCTGRHAPGQTCATMDPPCGQAPGACCYVNGNACQQLPVLNCVFGGGSWLGVGVPCDECPCVVSCPPGSVPEQDACGEDTNFGCQEGEIPTFQDIALGDTVCGTIDAIADVSRDTDWYRFTSTEPMTFTIAAEAEFDTANSGLNLAAGLIEYNLTATGTGNCEDISGFIEPFFTAPECTPGSATSICLPAGTYFAFASVDDFFDLPCGEANDYHITVTGTPCVLPTGACCLRDGSCLEGQTSFQCAGANTSFDGWNEGETCAAAACLQPAPGDYCALPISVNVPAALPYADANGTCGRLDDYSGTTCLGSYDGGEDIVYQLVVTAETNVHITMNPQTTTWSGITLADSCPPGASCIATVTNSGTDVRDLGCKTLAPGTYTIMIDTWPSPDCVTAFDLNIETCVPPLGRCCIDGGVSCQDLTEVDCATAGGDWLLGTDCTNPCPVVIGEDCDNATVIPSVPYVANFDNSTYTGSPPTGSCNSSSATVMQNDGWFEYTPAGTCTATLTIDGPDYDGIANVLSGECGTFTEITCLDEPQPMVYSFTMTGGVTYFFQIGDWGVSPGGGPTSFSLDCQADPVGECCTGEACTLVTESACTTGGGAWILGGDCSPNPCLGGDDCNNPITVTLNPGALPWTDTNYTCGRGNDYADTCLGSYDGGEDITYELVVTQAIDAQITMNPKTTTWTGIGIDDGTCPLGATGCIATVTRSDTTPRVITCRTYAPGTYYMMMDTWPTPNCIADFDVTIEACVPPQGACCAPDLTCSGTSTQYQCEVVNGGKWYSGQTCPAFSCPVPPADTCDVATPIKALPYSQPGINPATMTDDANVSPSCDSSSSCSTGPANNGWWYTLTPTNNCSINVARVGGIDSVASVWNGPTCTSLTQVGCVDSETTAAFNLVAGTKYWILVSNWSCSSEPTAITTVNVTGNCVFTCGDLAPPGGDGTVGMSDYLAFIDAFGSCTGGVKYNPAADFDADGCVTWVDYQSWLTCYRNFIGNPTAPPPGGKNPIQMTTKKGKPIASDQGQLGGLQTDVQRQ